MQQRYDSLQVLRIFGAILVLTYHFGAVELKYGADRLITPLLAYSDTIIDVFFVTSGFLMGYLYRNTPAGLTASIDFAIRRAFRVYPAYILVSLVVIGIWLGSGRHIFGHMVGPDPRLLSSLLLVPSASRPVLPVAWTLLHEVYFYAGFAVLLLFKPARRPMAAFVWGAGSLLGYILLRDPQAHPGLALAFSPYTLEFLAGVAMGWWAPSMRRVMPRTALCAAAALWVAGIVLTGFDPARKLALPGAMRITLDGATALLLTYGLIAADLKRLWRCPASLVKAGDWSYDLYLVHTVVIGAVCYAWKTVSLHGLWANAAIYLVCLAISLVVSQQLWTRVGRPAARFGGRLAGQAGRWLGALRPAVSAPSLGTAPAFGAPEGSLLASRERLA